MARSTGVQPSCGAGASGEPAGAAQLAIFSFLLALGILLHQSLGHWALLDHTAVLGLIALAVLLRPASLGLFLALCAAQLVSLLLELPMVVNHWLLLGIMSLSVLLCAALTVRPGRSDRENRAALWAAAAPVLRAQVALMYVFVTLAKLNAHFFDAEVSCAASMCRSLAEEVLGLPFPDWMALPAIWGTLAIEAGVPLLLLLPATRLPAIAIGMVFHALLALKGFVPFSGLVVAFYALFLPDDLPRRLELFLARNAGARAVAGRLARLAGSRRAFAGAALLWLLGGAAFEFRWLPGTLAHVRYAVLTQGFALYAAALLGILLAALRQGGAPWYRSGAFRLAHPLLALAPLLVVLNGLCPYLGLKTHHSFAMFSNLRTEGEYWNHAFLPRAMRLFPYQADLVRIVSSDDPRLAEDAEDGSEWVYFQLRDYLTRNPDVSVTFVRGGEEVSVARVGDDPRFAEGAPGALARHLFWFRTVHPPQAGWCPY
jgi:hypothetical protein